jgi:hypothetical protein
VIFGAIACARACCCSSFLLQPILRRYAATAQVQYNIVYDQLAGEMNMFRTAAGALCARVMNVIYTHRRRQRSHTDRQQWSWGKQCVLAECTIGIHHCTRSYIPYYIYLYILAVHWENDYNDIIIIIIIVHPRLRIRAGVEKHAFISGPFYLTFFGKRATEMKITKSYEIWNRIRRVVVVAASISVVFWLVSRFFETIL